MKKAKLNQNEKIKMCIYCLHKMNIIIHVLNHFNYKVMQISWPDCKQPHDGIYLLPNFIHFITHLYLFLWELNTLFYLQCKYTKRYLYDNNIQTFNLMFVNVHDLLSKVFGLNVDV